MDADRITGTLLGLAAGDALGAGYEFAGPPPECAEMVGRGLGAWAPGEWTDDTQMAVCIAEAYGNGRLEPTAVAARFLEWYRTDPPDIGSQTRRVLGAASGPDDVAAAAASWYRRHPRNAAGNGSLMRTAPVALAHLGDPEATAASAREISDLTHADPEAGDACVLWCLAIDRAIRDGTFDLRAGLAWIPATRRATWAERIAAAEHGRPTDFPDNGWVVHAFQAAWSAIVHAPERRCAGEPDRPGAHLQEALHEAIRAGGDTDTVAAIAGSLLGARWGARAVPEQWRSMLHSRYGQTADDLERHAMRLTGG